jgi:hypothetical protein
MSTDAWSFIKENQGALSMIGTAIAALATGVWAIVKFVLSRQESKKSPSPNGDAPLPTRNASSVTVEASHGGVVAGRDIRDSNIRIEN